MRKLLKSYIAFTGAGYRIIFLVVLPLALLVFSGFVLAGEQEPNGLYPENWLWCYMIGFEIMNDYWLFGGICSREGSGMEYLKTSVGGTAVLRKGIIGDLLRRFVYIMGFGIFCYAFTGAAQDIVTAMLAYIVVVAFLNLTRHVMAWQIQLLADVGAAILFWLLALMCWLPATIRQDAAAVLVSELVVCGVLALVTSAVTVWHMTYCVKGSYYEK